MTAPTPPIDRTPRNAQEAEERHARAAGGLEVYEAYIAAGVALHKLAKLLPWSLGMDVGDVYKEVTARLQRARRP